MWLAIRLHITRQTLLTITGLGALLAEMSHLIAVAALDVVHILGLGALLRHMALLATVAAAAWAGLGAVLAEVTH